MIPSAVMVYCTTKHGSTGIIPNMMLFGREITELVDLVAGTPPNNDCTNDPPLYILQWRLQLSHQRGYRKISAVFKETAKQENPPSVVSSWCCSVALSH